MLFYADSIGAKNGKSVLDCTKMRKYRVRLPKEKF